MTFNSIFDCGTTVYFLHDGKIRNAAIEQITIEHSIVSTTTVKYMVRLDTMSDSWKYVIKYESECFVSRESLLYSL
jgi:hypothetical protein